MLVSFITKIQAQCNEVITISICDMTIIDGNSDGEPDGIINLYEQYNDQSGAMTPISLSTGTWFDPNFNFALNEASGDLFLWDLDNASESITDYQFQLIDATSSCTDGILVTINLILGPFSGFGRPVLDIDDVNLEICDVGSTPQEACFVLPDVDLFEALESIPSPHLNGQWIYNGSSPNFVSLAGSDFTVTIPYVSGPPLADQETFELTYRISGIPPCGGTFETTVNVSVTRQVFSGHPLARRICELDILDGVYNSDVDLTDDEFLLQEDLEGLWITDAFGQITTPNDSNININDVYQQIIANEGLRFGSSEFGFSYSVDQRSGVCNDALSTVLFKVYEYLRPFSQNDDTLEFCEDTLTEPTTLNLFDQLEFTTENGVLFDYVDNGGIINYTNWELISGPSRLGLISNTQANYTSQGTINLQNAAPGNYVFEYQVNHRINYPDDAFVAVTNSPNQCIPSPNNQGFCSSETARVIFTVHPKLYAGENTSGLEFCETDVLVASPLDLFSLLEKNPAEGPIYQGPLGVWSDVGGNVVNNPVNLLEVNNQQTFNFIYSTTSSNGCLDRANLSFKIFEEFQPGISTSIDVCNDNITFNLFNELGGTPNTNGTWAGPNDYATTGHNAVLDPSNLDAGVYTYTVPDNVNDDDDILCIGSSATVTITLHQSPNIGAGGLFSVCQSEAQIDLIDYLDSGVDTSGSFRDLDMTNLLTGSLLDVSQLDAGEYDFQYEIQGHPSCGLSSIIITISIIEVVPPVVTNQTFCVTDGATIDQLVVDNAQDFNWYADAISTIALSSSELLIDGEDYFVSAVDSNDCESPRVSITVTLLPLGNLECIDCLKDGISVNGDGENDAFTLCRLPVAFPDFEINIFNRYGTKVYRGNRNTELFNGVSNQPLTIGKALPSGTYFYVFDPKDGISKPFQGNFYLSR